MKKRALSAIIAFVLLLSTCAPMFSYAQTLPYVDENGKYHRLSNGAELTFETDYESMVDYFISELKARKSTITYQFATTDESYKYEKSNAIDNSSAACDKLVQDLFYSVYTKNSANPVNAAGGDYLFKSIRSIDNHAYTTYLSNGDNPTSGNSRYYTYKLVFSNIKYFSTAAQESAVERIGNEFKSKYIKSGASDYDKVKTIYDFVVRNADYDWDVFNDKYSTSSERYNIAHSAYGALVGSLEDADDYDMTSKKTVTDLNVISSANQGLAVCEGYSKLFYYLCVSNGIPCRIVDGDYTSQSGVGSDAHEWNYVWLNDGSGDGYKWFQVDTTFAAQHSLKSVDMNDYKFFLCGSENSHFNEANHQQPYQWVKTDITHPFHNVGGSVQATVIYDFYGTNKAENCVSSKEDYRFILLNLNNVDALNNGYIIRRRTTYEGETEVKTALVYSNKEGQHIINIEEDNVSSSTSKGFKYNGKTNSEFDVLIPYLDSREYSVTPLSGIKDVGTYYMDVKGAGNSSVKVKFDIIKADLGTNYLDEGSEVPAEYDEVTIQNEAPYTGNVITPRASIIDGHNNKLVEGVDYDIKAYSDPSHTWSATIREIGTYYIDIAYKGNYKGHCYITFTVDRIDLAKLNYSHVFQYLPKSIREQHGFATPADYFSAGAKIHVGTYYIYPNVDFSVTSSGNLAYGSSGKLYLKGISSSSIVVPNSECEVTYNVTDKFDISGLNGSAADTGRTNVYFYTGSAIVPDKFDYLDSVLERGIDYKINSITNNVNAGEALVNIEGINGCEGKATLKFVINKESIAKATITASAANSVVSYTVNYKGKTLVKGTDYTETITATATGYTIKLTGINNFTGGAAINVREGSDSGSGSGSGSSSGSESGSGSGSTTPVPVDNSIRPSSGSSNRIHLSYSSATYTGKALCPAVTLYNSAGKVVNTKYYTVTYSNNINVGKALVTLTFRNGYRGNMYANFVINPKKTSLSKVTAAKKAFTVKWKKLTTQTTGYQIQYSTDKGFKKGNKTVNITKNKTTSKKVTGLKAKKTYYVRIRTYKTVGGVKYYSGWSASKKVKTK